VLSGMQCLGAAFAAVHFLSLLLPDLVLVYCYSLSGTYTNKQDTNAAHFFGL
jgi:hypothetical protein